MTQKTIQVARTVTESAEQWTCDRCGARHVGTVQDRPTDWAVLGGETMHRADFLHFCPACTPGVVADARGRK